MIKLSSRRRLGALVIALGAVLGGLTTAPTAASAAPDACPLFADKAKAAIAHDQVTLGRITPKPVWRAGCATLYRSDNRGPAVIFAEGFAARNIDDGTYDVRKYVLENTPSPFVSTSYDHDLFKSWGSAFHYYIDAPGGLDVNRTIGDKHKYAGEREVAFPGGIKREYIIGACPIDKETRTEKMSDCESNPHFTAWH